MDTGYNIYDHKIQQLLRSRDNLNIFLLAFDFSDSAFQPSKKVLVSFASLGAAILDCPENYVCLVLRNTGKIFLTRFFSPSHWMGTKGGGTEMSCHRYKMRFYGCISGRRNLNKVLEILLPDQSTPNTKDYKLGVVV